MLRLTVAILFAGLVQQAILAPTLDSDLMQKLQVKETRVNILVILKEKTYPVLAQLDSQIFGTREERLNAVHTNLRDFTSTSQKPIVDLLVKEQDMNPFTFQPFWITNQIYVKGANLDLVLKLAKMTEVEEVVEEELFPLDEPLDMVLYDNLPPYEEEEAQWGVEMIQAPGVWAEGNTGEEIIIATIDTGARVTHEALKDNHRSEYGWYDPGAKTPIPNDGNGHGTHTTGNIAGTMRKIGVAPGAKWIACKGCATSSCARSDLLGCAQFCACPTDANGENADCSKAPHLVSNSWGGGRGDEWFKESVSAIRTAGIIPLFSQGNSGPFCASANSPGDYDNLVGVGSTDSTDKLSSFSSVGPTSIGARMKPDIAAPGSNVFSSHHLSDTAYASMSGTSMACPHAAGTVALILSKVKSANANATVSYDQVLESLKKGGVLTTSTGRNCGDVPEDQLPNHHVGYGRINALTSVNVMERILKL